jgi:hypothetical protein
VSSTPVTGLSVGLPGASATSMEVVVGRGVAVGSAAGPGLAIVVGDGWAVWSERGAGVTGTWGLTAPVEGEVSTTVGEIVGWTGLAVGTCAVALTAGGTVVPVLVGGVK